MSAAQSSTVNLTLYNHPEIKQLRSELRQINNEIEEKEIDTRSFTVQKRETQKSKLLKMGQVLEAYLKQNEMDFMISKISENIISFLEKDALENLIEHVNRVLPENYKREYTRAPQIQSKQTLAKLQEETEKNIEDKLSRLKKGDIKQAYELKLKELKKLEEIAEQEEESLIPDNRSDESERYSELDELDRIEAERFSSKASIGEPLPPVDTTEDDNDRIQDAIQEYIDTLFDYKKEIAKFPPINHETAMGLIKTFEVKTQALRPYTDDKFRRSYPQWFNIIKKKIDISATNASKVSAIAAAHRVNPKTGQPLMRHITKEQIDSMNETHLNFIVEWFNEENYNSDYWLSKAFEENKCRCLEDRAIDLHEKLSHLS